LDELVARYRGQDFSRRLRYLVGTFTQVERRIAGEAELVVDDLAASLAQETLAEPEKLRAELAWLVSPEAKRAALFGQALGRADEAFSWLGDLLQALDLAERPMVGLLGGYLAGQRRRDQARVERVLDQIAGDERRRQLLVHLSWFAGASPATADRLLDGLRRGWLTGRDLTGLGYGLWFDGLGDEAAARFLLQAVSLDPLSVWTILHLAYYLWAGRKDKPGPLLDLMERLVNAPELLVATGDRPDWWGWSELAQRLLSERAESDSPVLGFMTKLLHQDRVDLDWPHYPVVHSLLQIQPQAAWEVLGRALLTSPRAAWGLEDLFQGRRFSDETPPPNLLSLVPPDILWPWVEANRPQGPEALARVATVTLTEALDPLVRELLVRYGHLPQVNQALWGNFATGGWTGPDSAYYGKKLAFVQGWETQEREPRVKAWCRSLVHHLEGEVASARQREQEEDEDRRFKI
jgi:hypothetical protein